MRRFIAAFVAIMVLALVSVTGLAADGGPTEWKYSVTEDGIEIQGYTGSSEDIVIPDEIDGMPVTRIGQDAFRNGTMRSVEVPDSVDHISSFVWKDCKKLEKVRLPYRASYIGSYAFEGCTSLRSVVLPKGIKDVLDLFQDCTQLEQVVIPYGAEYIAGYCFAHCGALQPLTVPETVTEVGHSAFGGCDRMMSVTYGGSRSQWNAMTYESDIPLWTRVWSTDGMHFDVKLSGPAGPLVPGQVVDIEVSCDDEIPDWAELAVELDLEGIAAPSYQVTLTAENKSAVFTGTVASDVETASVKVVAVGGRGIASAQWQAAVANPKSTRYETDEIGVGSDYRSVQDFLAQYNLPDGTTISVLEEDGSVRDGSLPLATGNLIRFQYPDGSGQTLGTVIKGDVLGTGLLGMDQLVRLAEAVTGASALDELAGAAADLNGNGKVDLSDLVQLAKLYKDATLHR